MDILLVPGLWLDSSSWDDIVPALTAAGHTPLPLTLPGVGDPAERSADIGIADWVDAVVTQIDVASEPVVLVGHSGGGNVVWGAAAARADRVAQVIFVDTTPPPDDASISEFDVIDGVTPFPGWDYFPAEDVYDLDAETRARTLPLTQSVPARVPTDPVPLTGAQHRVPVTILMGSMDRQQLEAVIDQWSSYADEYRAIADVTVRKIGSGHWPQFSQPARLAELINESVAHAQSTVDGNDGA
ncbi:alpha/beta fold hydrolase [Microbacterium sp. A204]|uniref:alpha/beta fold hydrolase n=1 Tax=Microbacterium sp. A204 TaxID=3457321 RepID=UPI003FD53242